MAAVREEVVKCVETLTDQEDFDNWNITGNNDIVPILMALGNPLHTTHPPQQLFFEGNRPPPPLTLPPLSLSEIVFQLVCPPMCW